MLQKFQNKLNLKWDGVMNPQHYKRNRETYQIDFSQFKYEDFDANKTLPIDLKT